MFKVGDKVKRIGECGDLGTNMIKGNIYTVVKMARASNGVLLKEVEGWWDASCFQLVEHSEIKKNPIKTEVEWLDRVRDNFKE